MRTSKLRRLGAVVLCLALPAGAAEPLQPALEPVATGGVALLDRALAKLSVHRRLLVVAAHPDDEDTALLTLVARGEGGEAAYLSLSRGEGGQNLIGSQLEVDLGLIRSRELLAARGIDGARQYFTRAYDFGYTRSLAETFERWPQPVLLEDVVRIVRRFRPQVMVAIFPPTPQAGHGQHQASAVMAELAFAQAGDPAVLPALAEEGLHPWSPQAFYRAGWFAPPEVPTLNFPLGAVDPISGKSFLQLATASRSQHRSQDMGRVQEPGARDGRLVPAGGTAGIAGDDPFAGVDTRLAAMASALPAGELRGRVEVQLEAVEQLARRTRQQLAPVSLGAAVAPLAEITGRLQAARRELGTPQPASAEDAVAGLIDEKLEVASAALAAAAGLMVDAWTEQERLVPGTAVPVVVTAWNSGPQPLAVDAATLRLPAGWELRARDAAEPFGELPAGAMRSWRFEVAVPAAAPPSRPYFLQRPLAGSLYDWSDVPAAMRGEPFEPPLVSARVDVTVAGAAVGLEREVVQRYGDQARGEVRRPLRVVPALEVEVTPERIVWPQAETRPRQLAVRLVNHTGEALAGQLEVTVPPGWPAVPSPELRVAAGGETRLELAVRPPVPLPAGRFAVRVAAVTADGRRYELAVPVLDFEHIRPTPSPRRAEVALSLGDIRLPPLRRVGYVRGAADRVPEALAQIGLPVELLSGEQLRLDDLSAYTVIVVGSRAYEVDPGLVEANARLLDYVRGGGRLIVQYQQYQFVQGGFAPHPLDIARPHGRVTDEGAEVTLLVPEHAAFTTPNRLGPEDWQHWVQERGLYFAGTWDPAYTPLLAMADPEGPELRGGLLVARLGEGTYVYTGLAFFRQLPAGVVGAFRLFANLLALDAAGG